MRLDVEKKPRESFYISAGDKYHKAYIEYSDSSNEMYINTIIEQSSARFYEEKIPEGMFDRIFDKYYELKAYAEGNYPADQHIDLVADFFVGVGKYENPSNGYYMPSDQKALDIVLSIEEIITGEFTILGDIMRESKKRVDDLEPKQEKAPQKTIKFN